VLGIERGGAEITTPQRRERKERRKRELLEKEGAARN